MARYRKKPVVIEAVRLGWDTWGEMCDHAGVGKLLEGLMIGTEGDWIIRGVEGELYPCKPGIFWATYEPVVDHRGYPDPED